MYNNPIRKYLIGELRKWKNREDTRQEFTKYLKRADKTIYRTEN
jgi:hypothetical protein